MSAASVALLFHLIELAAQARSPYLFPVPSLSVVAAAAPIEFLLNSMLK